MMNLVSLGQTIHVWLLTVMKLIVALIRSLGLGYKQCLVKARFLPDLLQFIENVGNAV